LDTSGIDEVDHVQRYGLEGAFQYRSFHFQSEYIMANVIRQDKSSLEDASFEGGYAFLAWALTGERRAWNLNDGEFGQLIPKNNKLGAWEVAVRYSHLDLNDADAGVYGGTANNITFGLNWYPNPNVKFQTSYTIVDQSQNADSEGDYDVGEDGYDTNYFQFMTVVFW
jgi:phosphate-selective porin OprO/OprP